MGKVKVRETEMGKEKVKGTGKVKVRETGMGKVTGMGKKKEILQLEK